MRQVDQDIDQPIEDVLEACRVRLVRGDTIEACLAAYPSRAAALTELLPVAIQAQSLASVPDPERAVAARRRFAMSIAAARENRARGESARYRGPFGWLVRIAVPLVLVLAMSASGLGLALASDGSLPDSPLYSVKQASNKVALFLARTPEGRAAANARIANRQRLDLDYAEQNHKALMVRLVIARAMVEASDRATEQALLIDGPNRAEALKNLTRLLQAEEKSLNPLANDARVQVATDAKSYQQELESNVLKVTAK